MARKADLITLLVDARKASERQQQLEQLQLLASSFASSDAGDSKGASSSSSSSTEHLQRASTTRQPLSSLHCLSSDLIIDLSHFLVLCEIVALARSSVLSMKLKGDHPWRALARRQVVRVAVRANVVTDIFSNCPHLHSLHLLVDGRGLRTLKPLEPLQHLRTLRLGSLSACDIRVADSTAILRACPGITQLDAPDYCLDGAALQLLPELRVLNLKLRVDGPGLQTVKPLQHLRTLRLEPESGRQMPDTTAILSACPSITHLDAYSLDDAALQLLPDLRVLNLKFGFDGALPVERLASLPDLQQLRVRFHSVVAHTQLVSFPALEELITGMMDEVSMLRNVQFPHLRVLHSFVFLNDLPMLMFAAPNLEELRNFHHAADSARVWVAALAQRRVGGVLPLPRLRLYSYLRYQGGLSGDFATQAQALSLVRPQLRVQSFDD